ncbi:hypothetical protein OIU79_010838 [Salix purpurea]|uniref:NAD(P)-binding domain-containing protein n=1 Tax=Salix purpurea TaxID=77065 RepID=A0A9Q0QGK0_SALPP|nr:hypothetical protein OIU79_010838 [Salix purpurea]KAJ6706272.1 hypothetical protein OIU79_010838 [Salix purpurea]
MAIALPSTTICQTSFSFPSQNPCKVKSPSLIFPTKSHDLIRCSAKKKISFVDRILDYIEGGPKLRKWYGAPDLLPKDGSDAEDEDELPEANEVRDAVLVTDGDSEIGQMIILSLIVKKARVKALVKDKRAAMEAFGTYVESMAGDASSQPFLKKALRGVRAIICPNVRFYGNSMLSPFNSLIFLFGGNIISPIETCLLLLKCFCANCDSIDLQFTIVTVTSVLLSISSI